MAKFLVMKAHFSSDACVDTPSAFVVEIDEAFMAFLKTFTENSAPFLDRLKEVGFCKTAVNAYFGDWLCLKDDQEEQQKKFWDQFECEYAIVEDPPTFLQDANLSDVDVETQSTSCDNPAFVNFKATLYDESVEVFTDDVPILLLAEAVGFKLPKKTESGYAGDPTHCPVCGEDDIWSDNGDFDVSKDGKEASSPVYCKACQSKWVDFYQIAGYRKLVKGETQ